MMNGVGTVHKRNLKKCMDLFVHDALSDNSSEKKKVRIQDFYECFCFPDLIFLT